MQEQSPVGELKPETSQNVSQKDNYKDVRRNSKY